MWAGANDLFFQLGLAQAGAISATDVQTNLATAATQLVQQVAILNAAGARYIVVFNLPDVGSTPFGRSSGQGATISALSSFFNSTLSAGLDSLHIDLIRLNIFSLLNEVVADPAAYGFVNATSPACTVASLLCTSSTLVAPNASGVFGRLRPFARVTWEKEYDNDERMVRAGLVSTGGVGFGRPALRPDDSYALIGIGASADLGNRFVAFASVNATAGKNDGNYQAVTLSLRLPL